jgi:hypothetical protein
MWQAGRDRLLFTSQTDPRSCSLSSEDGRRAQPKVAGWRQISGLIESIHPYASPSRAQWTSDEARACWLERQTTSGRQEACWLQRWTTSGRSPARVSNQSRAQQPAGQSNLITMCKKSTGGVHHASHLNHFPA